MGQKSLKVPIIPYKGIRFSVIVLNNRAEIFCGNSEDYYLSFCNNKSRFWALFAIFDFLALKGGEAPQVPIRVWGLKTLPKS